MLSSTPRPVCGVPRRGAFRRRCPDDPATMTATARTDHRHLPPIDQVRWIVLSPMAVYGTRASWGLPATSCDRTTTTATGKSDLAVYRHRHRTLVDRPSRPRTISSCVTRATWGRLTRTFPSPPTTTATGERIWLCYRPPTAAWWIFCPSFNPRFIHRACAWGAAGDVPVTQGPNRDDFENDDAVN